jgi:ATP-binding cassette subfamily F protein 3
MSLLAAQDLVKAFGAQDLFHGVSLAVPHQARTALIGPNGVGKSTLLRILAGRERPDGGKVHRARGLVVGYLPQESQAAFADRSDADQTVLEFCLDTFSMLREMEDRLRRLEAQMADPHRAEEALAAYSPLQETFEREGGYTYVSRVHQVLRGLGLAAELWDRPLPTLSGGERSRVWLAGLLLRDPGLLLLDEPTNHLDIAAMEWLEAWLKDWPGAALIVSHDRYFLDRTVNTIWELSSIGMETFPGNYSAYVAVRAARRLEQTRRFEAQQEKIKRERDFIQRNIAGQNTRQAKGRRKRLERLIADELVDQPRETRGPRLSLQPATRGGEKAIETAGLVVRRPGTDLPLFMVPDLALERGECVAVMGPNGAGKTSLLKTLLAEVPPLKGTVQLGASVHPAHLRQTESELHGAQTVLRNLQDAAPDLREREGRAWLAGYGLAEDADKTVDALSGGERRRLALARLALTGANLLLLDEPTNNLDLPAQDALQEVLAAFSETILLVTHDRYLAGALATQIWTISPEGQDLEVFRGTLAELNAERARHVDPAPASGRAPSGRSLPKTGSKRRSETLEAQVEQAELALAALGREVELAGDDLEAVQRLGREYAEREHELEALMEAWARAAREESPA